MADLGYRENVMGPQPIGRIVEQPPEVREAADRFIQALMRGDVDAAKAMTEAQAYEDLKALTAAIAPGRYDKVEYIGGARVAKHFFLKVRLPGTPAVKFQFRLGQNAAGEWTMREANDLTGRRSAWSR
jgi:hypothetical protein